MSHDKDNSSAMQQQMLVAHNLRASHRIITKLERSKANTEAAIDLLPDAYFVVDEKGTVLRTNESASRLLNSDVESTYGRNMNELFTKETWNIFFAKLSYLCQATRVREEGGEAHLVDLSFEAHVTLSDSSERHYHWTLRIFKGISNRRGYLVNVFGRDITQMREFESQLSKIFAMIPLGIVTIDHLGRVNGPYSAYTEYLLGRGNLANVDFFELVFTPSMRYLSRMERQGVLELKEVFGQAGIWFDLGRNRYPAELTYVRGPDKEECWLGLAYHPIVIDDKIEKLLIVLEDRTELVQNRRSQVQQETAEHSMIQKMMDIQNCDADVLHASFNDLTKLLEGLNNAASVGETTQFCNVLHGMKGIARAAGLRQLKDMTHALESSIFERLELGEELGRDALSSLAAPLGNECFALQRVYRMLNDKDEGQRGGVPSAEVKALQKKMKHYEELLQVQGSPDLKREFTGLLTATRNLTAQPLAQLENRLRELASKTAITLHKHVEMEFHWGGVTVDNEKVAQVYNILAHLVNNAIDHGIELANVRLALGKPEVGKLSLIASRGKQDGLIRFGFTDDGAGLNPARLKECAAAKGLATSAELAKMDDAAALQLIFRPGFSTKTEVSEISGRGIGLDSVAASVKALGGEKITALHSPAGGSRFEFTVDLD